jgi:hypothetical protein
MRALIPFLLLTACATTDDGPADQLQFDGKADGFSIPNKAWLPLEKPETLAIGFADDAGAAVDYVYAELAISEEAQVTFSAPEIELYLYKQLDTTWWTQVGKHKGTLSATVDKGPYRLLMHRKHQDVSSAMLTTGCTGKGCTVYTAFPQHPAQIVNVMGGPVMTAPHLVAVTFDGDPMRDDIEAFVGTIGATDYWKATTLEYGVAAATAGAPVRLAEAAPASLSQAEAQAWVAAKLDGTHPEFGTPDANAFYVVFFPETTKLTMGTDVGCVGFGGYHSFTSANIVFAALPRCASFNGLSGMDALGAATSHELIEGVTDPLVNLHTAFALPDDDHFAWEIESGGEAGDMCAFVPGANTKVPGFPYLVQRSWSNAEARGGHDPCVPHVATEPYVVAAAVLDHIKVMGNSTLGVQVPVGQSRTIELDISSAGPTAKGVALKAVDGNFLKGAAQNLELTFDRATADNGDRVHLTIKANAADPRGFSTFIIAAGTDDTNKSLWHGFVVN